MLAGGSILQFLSSWLHLTPSAMRHMLEPLSCTPKLGPCSLTAELSSSSNGSAACGNFISSDRMTFGRKTAVLPRMFF